MRYNLLPLSPGVIIDCRAFPGLLMFVVAPPQGEIYKSADRTGISTFSGLQYVNHVKHILCSA